jgi:hypothetical protein
MNVTLNSDAGQARALGRSPWRVLQRLGAGFGVLVLAVGVAHGETALNLEAVNAGGVGIWSGSFPITFTGVLLTDPDEMLDAAADFVPWDDGAGLFQMGGEWQVFVQATAPGDRGGVECWMGQNYGNLPWLRDSELSYGNAAWTAEVQRVSHDPATGWAFRRGDLVTVTANGSLFYGGMQNINEEHSLDPAYDFSLSLASSNYGMPAPEALSLVSVMRPDDGNVLTHEDIFDPTRATGGEHWQGLRVRINGLTLVTTNGWAAGLDWDSRRCAATDGEGRLFTLIHPRYSLGSPPANAFDATGVFLQESGSGTDGTFGYELFVQEIAPAASPVLDLANPPGSLRISWPGSLSNFSLETSDALSAADWSPVTNSPVLVDGRNTVSLPSTGTRQFFRLRRTQ